MGIFSSNYKVFISFKGRDVGENIVSHLFKGLEIEKIKVFKDEYLEKGVERTPLILKIIKKSRISVVIFSEYYPNSHLCLDELVKINERRKQKKQIVVPVFYHVDPSDVQQLRGNYGTAINCYIQDPAFRDKVNKWKNALMDISNISGFPSDNPQYRPEAKLVEEVVDFISNKLSEYSSKLIGLGAMAGVAVGVVAL